MSRLFGVYDEKQRKVIWYDKRELEDRARQYANENPLPMIITDTMDPIRFQGLHYESKRAYEQAVRRQGLHIKSEADIPGSPFDLSNYDYQKNGITKDIDLKAIEADTEQAQAKAVEALRDGTMQLSPEQQQAANDINQIYTERTGRSATIIKDRACRKVKKQTAAN